MKVTKFQKIGGEAKEINENIAISSVVSVNGGKSQISKSNSTRFHKCSAKSSAIMTENTRKGRNFPNKQKFRSQKKENEQEVSLCRQGTANKPYLKSRIEPHFSGGPRINSWSANNEVLTSSVKIMDKGKNLNLKRKCHPPSSKKPAFRTLQEIERSEKELHRKLTFLKIKEYFVTNNMTEKCLTEEPKEFVNAGTERTLLNRMNEKCEADIEKLKSQLLCKNKELNKLIMQSGKLSDMQKAQIETNAYFAEQISIGKDVKT